MTDTRPADSVTPARKAEIKALAERLGLPL